MGDFWGRLSHCSACLIDVNYGDSGNPCSHTQTLDGSRFVILHGLDYIYIRNDLETLVQLMVD